MCDLFFLEMFDIRYIKFKMLDLIFNLKNLLLYGMDLILKICYDGYI